MLIQWINTVGSWFIPVFLLSVFLHGSYKKVPLYDTFIEGAKEGFTLAVKLLPYVVGIYVAVCLFENSGAMDILLYPLRPVLTFLGVPKEVVPLVVVRPLSGPAALGITANLIETFGPESYIGRLASVIDGSTDTTLYILAVYFASVGVKKPRYSLPVGLTADFAGFITAVLVCQMVFS